MTMEQHPLLSTEKGESYTIPESAPSRPTEKFEIDQFDGSNVKRQVTQQDLQHVVYDSSSHISVLFQMHGSLWSKVLPYCLFNVLVAYAITIAKVKCNVDVTISDNGLSFMGILAAFLIVTRAKIAYARFMEARNYLQIAYESCREIVQSMCVLTMHDMSNGAKKWRQDVAYQTIALLRVTIAAIEFESHQESAMTMVADSRRGLTVSTTEQSVRDRVMKWAHMNRSMSDENFRAPILLAYALRAEILRQRKGDRLKFRRADTKTPMHFNEERCLMEFVEKFISAFHGLKKLITTPFPFPLVQMARTFLFTYTFTLPFALVGDTNQPGGVMMIIFFITYGFLGLEYVAMELDDPFGDDPNDFDDLGMAKIVFEDIYLTIFISDGPRSAERLRMRVNERLEKKGALDEVIEDLNDDAEEAMSSVLSDDPYCFSAT